VPFEGEPILSKSSEQSSSRRRSFAFLEIAADRGMADNIHGRTDIRGVALQWDREKWEPAGRSAVCSCCAVHLSVVDLSIVLLFVFPGPLTGKTKGYNSQLEFGA
jgi:hypothetical protein